jgi:hypothetical protein
MILKQMCIWLVFIQFYILLTLFVRSDWRSRAATERHETRLLSAGTINKREQFHKGNKDMDVLCSVDPACCAGRAVSIGSSTSLSASAEGSAAVLICCQSTDRATAGVTHTVRHTKCDVRVH